MHLSIGGQRVHGNSLNSKSDPQLISPYINTAESLGS